MDNRIYANAVAKYNEGKLLDREKIKRLSEAEFLDAVKMLCDYGYGGGILNDSSYDIDKFISSETSKLIDYVVTDSPNAFLARCLTTRFLYSNAKAYYKNKFTNVEMSGALYKMDDFELKNAIESGDYAALNVFLCDALESLDKKFALEPADPKTIDLVLTRAHTADNLFCAKKCKSKAMQAYVCAEIDLGNIVTVLRCRSAQIPQDVCAQMLMDGGKLPLSEIIALYGAGDTLATAFKATSYDEILTRLSLSGSVVRFETETDDYLYALMAAEQDNMLSLSPFLSYFVAQLVEFKTVKMILVCLKNNAKDEIPKRLRAIYAY